MSATELLAGAGGSIKLIDEQILTASGNWTKVAAVKPTDRVVIQMWSGGGSGGLGSSVDEVTGGQGGNFVQLEFYAYELGASVACVVGSGGAAQTSMNYDGNDGGASAFGSILIPGGGGGLYSTTGYGNDPLHKRRIELLSSASMMLDLFETSNNYPNKYFSTPNPKMNIEAGGFWVRKYNGSNYIINVADRVYAGAAGGAVNRYLSIQPPGKSFMGGAGGAAVAAGTSGNGSIPGGGGGGKQSGLGGGYSGAGARGEIRVRVLRGAS